MLPIYVCGILVLLLRGNSLKIPIKRPTRTRISKIYRQHNGQKKKGQKDKQRSTKHTYRTKDRVTRTPHLNKFKGIY